MSNITKMEIKRKSYSIKLKLEAIEFSESNGNRKTAAHFGIDECMVRRWRKQMPHLTAVADKNKTTKQRNRRAKWPSLEKELHEWAVSMRDRGQQVTGRQILGEARVLGNKMKLDFKGSYKWVFNFMKRYNLVRRSDPPTVGQHLEANSVCFAFVLLLCLHLAHKNNKIPNIKEEPLF